MRYPSRMARPRTSPPPHPSASPKAGKKSTIDDLLAQLEVDASGPSELGNDDTDLWVKNSGMTPVEFLTRTYRNGFQPMQHRISAAKAVLDYAHRKLPQKLELEATGNVSVQQLDAAALSKLSPEELEALEKILLKAGGK